MTSYLPRAPKKWAVCPHIWIFQEFPRGTANVPIDVIIFTFYSDQLVIDVEKGIVTKQFFLELNTVMITKQYLNAFESSRRAELYKA